jgi:hypothetical protein
MAVVRKPAIQPWNFASAEAFVAVTAKARLAVAAKIMMRFAKADGLSNMLSP